MQTSYRESTAEPLPPHAQVINLLGGFMKTQLVYIAAKLDLAGLLADGPKTSAELAAATGCEEPYLVRVLRGLAACGVLEDRGDTRFATTDLGACLSSKAPLPLHDVAISLGEECYRAWGQMLKVVYDGGNAFEHAHGQAFFEYLRNDPAAATRFNRFMAGITMDIGPSVARDFDFSGFATVMDIGGGTGTMIRNILETHEHIVGTIYDQPAVVEAGEHGFGDDAVAARCRWIGGNFFESVPTGSEVLILSQVLHDWTDEQCGVILGHCRGAMTGRSRLLIVEQMIPDRVAVGEPSVDMDLAMMAVTGGRERTAEEFRQLLATQGLTLRRVQPTGAGRSILIAELA